MPLYMQNSYLGFPPTAITFAIKSTKALLNAYAKTVHYDKCDITENFMKHLNLNLLTTTIVAPPSNASKWQMGFNSAFKGLKTRGPGVA